MSDVHQQSWEDMTREQKIMLMVYYAANKGGSPWDGGLPEAVAVRIAQNLLRHLLTDTTIENFRQKLIADKAYCRHVVYEESV